MVTLVTTLGAGSMDLYARKLAEHLDVPKLYSDIYQRNAELFNIPLFCRTAMKSVWSDCHFIKMLNRENSIVHLPNHHLGRYGVFLKVPYIITVHDLIRYFDLKGYSIFIHRPNLRDKLYLSLDYRGVKKAAKIIAVSHTTKQDLVRHLGIPEERISVVYEGIDHRVFKPVEHRLVDYLYLLFVGSEHPRKNFIGLLKAFSKLKSERGFKGLKLVKVGKAGGPEAEFRKETLQAIQQLGLSNDVVFTDYISEEDLPAYYSRAECFILPSFYEGFGFPPLEAMACGCPVIVSNVASLPEVVGDAGMLVDPHDTDGMAKALYLVLSDDSLKKNLVLKGLKRASQFSWEKAARDTLKVYESVERALSTEYMPAEVERRSTTIVQRAKTPMKAVILVGGEGTRLRPLTYDTPKSMVPVLNRPFLEHSIAYLKKHQGKDIILALSYLPEIVQNYFGDGSNLGVKLTYAMENSPLGTAGAVKNAERYLDGTFAVLNGDIFSDLDMADMLAFHRRRGAKATIALTWVDSPYAFGVVETDSDGRVKHFIEKPSLDQVTTNWINAGVYILEPEVLRHVPPNSHYMFEEGLFPLLLERGEPIYGYPFSGYWLDMGTPEKYLQLNCDLLLGKTKSALIGSLVKDEVRSGEGVVFHPLAEIVGTAIIGSNCSISRGVHIRGPVVIGPDCYIGEGAIIEKAVLWKGVNIGRGATLKQCVVGNNTVIGDNAQVMDRTVIGDHVRIASDKRLELLAASRRMPLTLPQASVPAESSLQGDQFEDNPYGQQG